MTLTPPPPNRRMSLRQRWNKTSLANKGVVVLSALALVVSVLGIAFTIYFSTEQSKINSSVATFQAQVQTTADYQYNQQLSVQQTQIALQSQMDAWVRLQALPFIEVEIPPEHILTVQNVYAEQAASGYAITGEGTLDIVLSNNGGARAGLLQVDWLNDAKNGIVLFSHLNQVGNSRIELPSTIDAGFPIRMQLALEASIPYNDDPTGKSDYQLGEYWKKELQSNPNHIAITFSNTDPINVKIADIQLAMPVVAFQPNPTSYFQVTNKTPLAVRCFKTGGESIPVRITFLNENQKVETVVKDETCTSFPAGNYKIYWLHPNSIDTDTYEISIALAPQSSSPIDLTKTHDVYVIWKNLWDITNGFGNVVSFVVILSVVAGITATLFSGIFRDRLVHLIARPVPLTISLTILQDAPKSYKKSDRLVLWRLTKRGSSVITFKELNRKYRIRLKAMADSRYRIETYSYTSKKTIGYSELIDEGNPVHLQDTDGAELTLRISYRYFFEE